MYIKQPIIVSYKADFEGKSISVTGLGKPWGFQGVEGPRISRQSAYEDGKAVSPMHRPPLTPRKYSLYSFLLDAESTLRLE